MEKEMAIALKDVARIKNEMAELDTVNSNGDHEFALKFLDETARVERLFRSLNQANKKEFETIKAQVHTLKQDKSIAFQNASLLDEKIKQSESDVGFKEFEQQSVSNELN